MRILATNMNFISLEIVLELETSSKPLLLTFSHYNLIRKNNKLTPRYKFPCKFCQKICASFKYLNEHIRRAHDDQTYQCEICLKFYKHKSGLSEHMRREHEEKTLSCDKCDYVTNDKSSLKTHMENVHAEGDPTVPCLNCSKMFHTQVKLKAHISNVHRDRNRVFIW